MVIVVYGTEPWIIRRFKDEFKQKVENMDFGFGEFAEPIECVNFLMTCNILCNRLYATLKVDSTKSISDKGFLDFLKNIKEDSTKNLFIEITKTTKGSAKDLKALAEVADVRELNKVSDMETLKANLDFICQEQLANLTEGAKFSLLERLDYMHNEEVTLITLENYVSQLKYLSDVVDETDILNNVPDLVEGKRFMLASFIANGKKQAVMREAAKLRMEKDFNAIALMGLLHREYRIAYLSSMGYGCKEQGVRANNLKNLSPEKLLEGANIIGERMRDVKTGVYTQEMAFDICLSQLMSF